MTDNASPVRVLIADDQTLFRAGLARVLAGDSRLEIVGQAKDGEDAVDQTLARRPDVVLMDLQMPRVTGVQAVKRLALEAPEVNVLVLSAYADRSMVVDALASGAKGFVDKDVTPEDMVSRILAVSSGDRPGDARWPSTLSTRELNVLKQVAVGLSNKQIAVRLGISQKTVRNHLSRVFSKLGAGNRTEAVMNAMRVGLLTI
jgi:DNA-binding NarL/FixJ family response regulator